MHLMRTRTGYDMDAPPPTVTLKDRLARFTLPPNEKGCRLWRGWTLAGYGYVHIREGIPRKRVHRVIFDMTADPPLEPWEQVHHICGVRNCVEPTHLERATAAANTAEMLERNWYKRRIGELEAALAALDPEHDLLQADPSISAAALQAG